MLLDLRWHVRTGRVPDNRHTIATLKGVSDMGSVGGAFEQVPLHEPVFLMDSALDVGEDDIIRGERVHTVDVASVDTLHESQHY